MLGAKITSYPHVSVRCFLTSCQIFVVHFLHAFKMSQEICDNGVSIQSAVRKMYHKIIFKQFIGLG